jgi:hypothetical protein
VDNLRELREFLWCDHAPVTIQSVTGTYAHVALSSPKGLHLVVEDGKVKILCHACFCGAMQVRFKLDAGH